MNSRPRSQVFPFTALVGQDEMRNALLLNAVDPAIGGLMILGHRGTAKSTAVRGLAELMPGIAVVEGCPWRCDPAAPAESCPACGGVSGAPRRATIVPVPVVDLPLGATEDRVTGTLDLESALLHGRKVFEPGLLLEAHRGFLYIDEANLLEDHLVDLLLDVAAAGENVVERESISIRHPARVILIGTGNPEEGEVRPQLLDRFGLCSRVVTESDLERRTEIVRRRLAFDADPAAFRKRFAGATEALRARIDEARRRVPEIAIPDDLLRRIAALNSVLEADGHRGEVVLARAARAAAALDGRSAITLADVRDAAPLALRHRLRRDPLESRDFEDRLLPAIAKALGSDQ